MNDHLYCGAVSPDGLVCVRSRDHVTPYKGRCDPHMGHGEHGRAVFWPVESTQPEPTCAACNDRGIIELASTPYGAGWGTFIEAVPCACQYPKPSAQAESLADIRERVVGHAKKVLAARGLSFPGLPTPEDEDK